MKVKSCKVSWVQRLFGANKDKPLNPILRLDHSTHFICYRLLRNAISEICAPWFIAKDINSSLYHDINTKRMDNLSTDNGPSLITQRYLLAMCVEEEKWSKIHVVLIKKDNIEWLIENMDIIQQQIDSYLIENELYDNVMNRDHWALLLNHHDHTEEWRKIRWNTIVRIAQEYKSQTDDRQDLPHTDFAEIELISPQFYSKSMDSQLKNN